MIVFFSIECTYLFQQTLLDKLMEISQVLLVTANANDIYKCQNNFESISDTPRAVAVACWVQRIQVSKSERKKKIVYLYASTHSVSHTHSAHRTLQCRRLLMGTATQCCCWSAEGSRSGRDEETGARMVGGSWLLG